MKYNIKKSIKIFFIFMCILSIFTNFTNVFAEPYNVKAEFGSEASAAVTGVIPTIRTVLGMILDVVRVIGSAIAVIILLYISFKFMVAAPSEKANIKQYSMNYVIGACVLFGASNLLTFVRDFIFSIFNNQN